MLLQKLPTGHLFRTHSYSMAVAVYGRSEMLLEPWELSALYPSAQPQGMPELHRSRLELLPAELDKVCSHLEVKTLRNSVLTYKFICGKYNRNYEYEYFF